MRPRVRGPAGPTTIERTLDPGSWRRLAPGRWIAALALAACSGASGPPSPPGGPTFAAGPSPPTGGLSMPSLDLPWTPPSLSAGDVEGLRAALAAGRRIELVLGPRLAEPAIAPRFAAAIGELAPGEAAPVELGGRASLQEVIGAASPLRRIGVGVGGRPIYAADTIVVDPAWRREHPGATLVVDDAAVDPPTWSALQAYAVGTCEAPMVALAEGQELSLELVTPFLDHADGVLWRAFRAELQRSLPPLLGELAGDAEARPRADFADDRSYAAHVCGHAHHAYLSVFAACMERATPCPQAPRLLLVDGARVGLVEPPLAGDPECPALVGRDAAYEIRRIGREAARAAAYELDLEWSLLADRLGLLGEVVAVLEDICAPRRRRLTEADLAEARRRLAAIGAGLASPDHQARDAGWVLEDSEVHAPGQGKTRILARFDPGRGSINLEILAGARGLREWVLGRALCRNRRERPPLAALLIDEGGAASFFGYFHEEELVCGDLPPLRSDGAAGPVGG